MDNKIMDSSGRNYKNDQDLIDRSAGNYMNSGVTYQGAKTLEVLGDYRYTYLNGNILTSMSGMPINGKELDSNGIPKDSIEGGHSELDNSLQSHQNWRNWVFMMEAELAALVDLGYDVDLKSVYGKSYYADNKIETYRDGFFARNTARNAYIDNQSNTQTYGIGVHIYGKNNNITVSGKNLMAAEMASAGVWIDGSDNIFTIANGTKITANGINGMGIYTAFGKDHTININGEVEATGQGGIGIRADFGENTLGDDKEGRGSHFRWLYGNVPDVPYNSKTDPTKGGKYERQYVGNTYVGNIRKYDDRTPEMDLEGALIKDLNINGKVRGS
ncbi:MAG: hypothetical protein J6U11_00870, partial [Campylobacter sp.]|nr:hypothetical protein [Campylobacter sp.]